MHARELRLACGESYIELSVSGLRGLGLFRDVRA